MRPKGLTPSKTKPPATSKADAFSALLARAPERITEDHLVALQNLTATNPLDKAVQFCTGQNWLRNAKQPRQRHRPTGAGLPGVLWLRFCTPFHGWQWPTFTLFVPQSCLWQ